MKTLVIACLAVCLSVVTAAAAFETGQLLETACLHVASQPGGGGW